MTELATLYTQRDRFRVLCSENTRAGYAYDWKLFTAWCAVAGRDPLPASPETVCLFLTDQMMTGLKVATAARRASAIAYYHRANQHRWTAKEEVRDLLEGAQRLRNEQPKQKVPLLVEEVRRISEALGRDGSPRAVRDRAVVLLGFATALRRSNVASLAVDDLEFDARGLIVHVRKEKQDQRGRGRLIGVPLGACAVTCPAGAVRSWLAVRASGGGPLFTRIGSLKPLRPEAIASIVKHAVELIGLAPAGYGGHSLRSGFVTAAAEAGAGELVIAAQTGHRSMGVLRRYFRRQDVWRANACGMIGL